MARTKFMLALNPLVIERMERDAAEAGITVQEFIRAVIIPTYYRLKIQFVLPESKSAIEPFMSRKP